MQKERKEIPAEEELIDSLVSLHLNVMHSDEFSFISSLYSMKS